MRSLFTPPLYLPNADLLTCTAVNLSRRPVVVNIIILDNQGVERCGIGEQTLEPGHAAFQPCNSDLSIEEDPIRYCQVMVNGPTRSILVTAQANPPTGPAVSAP